MRETTMSELQLFFERLGIPVMGPEDHCIQFRFVSETRDEGSTADIERIERDDDVVIVASVWEWFDNGYGQGRNRNGRVVFDTADGRLLDSESDGEPVVIASVIAGMQRVAA